MIADAVLREAVKRVASVSIRYPKQMKVHGSHRPSVQILFTDTSPTG
jgi:hypothetical protein